MSNSFSMFFYHKWLFLLQTIPMKTSILAFFLFCCHILFSQNIGVNSTGAAPDNSAMLDIASTNKGLLIPRMPAALRLSISSPANSLLVFDTDSTAIFMYNGPLAKWERLNPTYNFNNIIMGNSVGDILIWNGSKWEPKPSCDLFTYLYKDNDGDGFGDKCEPLLACGTTFPCYVSTSTDNVDTDPTIYPGAPELCDNKDNNQDGSIDNGSVVGTGGVCVVGLGPCMRTGTIICVGGVLVCSATPGTPSAEICNGIDDNCNGLIDEGVLNTYFRDADGDGYGNPAVTILACSLPAGYVSTSADCNDANPAINPGRPELCNSIDDNCSGSIDETFSFSTYYRDADGDTYGNPAITILACSLPAGYVTNNTDCNDANAAINPGRTELCNSLDDNCNGSIDETFPTKGNACTVGVGACQRTGSLVCNGTGTGVICSATPGTPSAEICDNIDNNCNGVVDDGLTRSCYTGPAGTAGVGRCRSGTQNCSAGLWGACAGQVLPIPEILGNGIDDNCDGVVQ